MSGLKRALAANGSGTSAQKRAMRDPRPGKLRGVSLIALRSAVIHRLDLCLERTHYTPAGSAPVRLSAVSALWQTRLSDQAKQAQLAPFA